MTTERRLYGFGETVHGSAAVIERGVRVDPRKEAILLLLSKGNVVLMLEDGEDGPREVDDYLHGRRDELSGSLLAWRREELYDLYRSIRAAAGLYDCRVIGVDPLPYRSACRWSAEMMKQREDLLRLASLASGSADAAKGKKGFSLELYRKREEYIASNAARVMAELPNYTGVLLMHAGHVIPYSYADTDGAEYRTAGWYLGERAKGKNPLFVYSTTCFVPIDGEWRAEVATGDGDGSGTGGHIIADVPPPPKGVGMGVTDAAETKGEIETRGLQCYVDPRDGGVSAGAEHRQASRYLPIRLFNHLVGYHSVPSIIHGWPLPSTRRWMTFPAEEWEDIEAALDGKGSADGDRGECGTTRVQKEYRRWSVGEVVDSPHGPLRLIRLVQLADALRDHPHRDVMMKHPEWVEQLRGQPGDYITFVREPSRWWTISKEGLLLARMVKSEWPLEGGYAITPRLGRVDERLYKGLIAAVKGLGEESGIVYHAGSADVGLYIDDGPSFVREHRGPSEK